MLSHFFFVTSYKTSGVTFNRTTGYQFKIFHCVEENLISCTSLGRGGLDMGGQQGTSHFTHASL